MRTRYLALLVSASVAVAGVAAGCGGGGDDAAGEQSGTTPTAAGTSAKFDLNWADIPIRVLDGPKAFDHAVLRNLALGLEGLVKLDADGKVVPNLAESVENPDETTYVYTLRDGVRFSDGEPLTVEDVVYSLQRYMAKDSQHASDYANVRSITAKGEDTVVVELKEADVTWQYIPVFAGFILQKEHAEEVGVKKLGTPGNLPIGTGPWKFDSFKPDSGLELSPNPHWRGEDPLVENISMKYITEPSAMALALRSGEVDGTFATEEVRTFEAIPDVNLVTAPALGQWVLSFNTIVEPFDDVHVRRAIAYAMDREGMVSILSGGAEINEAIVNPTLFGSFEDQSAVEEIFASLRTYPYDLEAAADELAQSGHPDGFTTTMPVDSASSQAKLAQALAESLAEIGIELELREVSSNEWLNILYGPREELGLMISEYGSPYPDPSALLTYWLDPAGATENGLNSANFKDPRIGELLNEQRQTLDEAERLEAIGEILRISKEELPYAPIASPGRPVALSNEYVFSDFWGAVHLGAWPLNIQPQSG